VKVRGLRGAVSFLTRLPMGRTGSTGPDLAAAVPWLPVVGALLGVAVAAAYAAALEAFPPLVASTLAVGLGILLTGAFHEDGLADTADAFGGGWSREETLRILKDPAHGTYGVLALALDLLLRIGALAAVDRWSALALLPGAHALSRAASVGLLRAVPPATDDGLGASFARVASRSRATLAFVAAVLVALVSLGAWALPAMALVALGALLVGRLSVRRLGGMTGDVLGAVQQVGEILVLLLGAAVAAHGHAIAWWR
jgi:adenosylcobinamide-GDP ribazoletransferase